MQRLTLFFNFRVELGLHFWVIHFVHELHFVPVDPKTKQLRRSCSHVALKERVKRSRPHGKPSPSLIKPECGRVIFEQVRSFPVLLRLDCKLKKVFHEANRSTFNNANLLFLNLTWETSVNNLFS